MASLLLRVLLPSRLGVSIWLEQLALLGVHGVTVSLPQLRLNAAKSMVCVHALTAPRSNQSQSVRVSLGGLTIARGTQKALAIRLTNLHLLCVAYDKIQEGFFLPFSIFHSLFSKYHYCATSFFHNIIMSKCSIFSDSPVMLPADPDAISVPSPNPSPAPIEAPHWLRGCIQAVSSFVELDFTSLSARFNHVSCF